MKSKAVSCSEWFSIVISLIAIVISVYSYWQVDKAQKAQIRPWIIIDPASNQLSWGSNSFHVFQPKLDFGSENPTPAFGRDCGGLVCNLKEKNLW